MSLEKIDSNDVELFISQVNPEIIRNRKMFIKDLKNNYIFLKKDVDVMEMTKNSLYLFPSSYSFINFIANIVCKDYHFHFSFNVYKNIMVSLKTVTFTPNNDLYIGIKLMNSIDNPSFYDLTINTLYNDQMFRDSRINTIKNVVFDFRSSTHRLINNTLPYLNVTIIYVLSIWKFLISKKGYKDIVISYKIGERNLNLFISRIINKHGKKSILFSCYGYDLTLLFPDQLSHLFNFDSIHIIPPITENCAIMNDFIFILMGILDTYSVPYTIFNKNKIICSAFHRITSFDQYNRKRAYDISIPVDSISVNGTPVSNILEINPNPIPDYFSMNKYFTII